MYALTNINLSLNKHYKWKIKINNLASWIAFGICYFKKII